MTFRIYSPMREARRDDADMPRDAKGVRQAGRRAARLNHGSESKASQQADAL